MRDIGIDVKPPTGEWDGDENCPFYGSLRLRGQVLEGARIKCWDAQNNNSREEQCPLHAKI